MGQGIGTSSIAFMLAAVGYDATLEVQSEACVSGIHALGTVIPLIAYISLIGVMLYINKHYEKKMPEIRAELRARKANQN